MHFFSPTTTILSVTGKHSERYLQARLSNDVRLCSPHRAILAAALTPQGRTEAFGALWRDSSGAFHLVLEGADREALTTAITRFKVAEQVEFTPSDLRVLHVAGEGAEAALKEVTGLVVPKATPGTVGSAEGATGPLALIRRIRTPTVGIDVIAPSPTIESLINTLRRVGGTEISPTEQVALRLEAKVASFPEDFNDSVILAEVGIPDSVSFTKGCYTGQEVMAKIDSLGKPPRILTRLFAAGSHEVPPATPVLANGKQLGKTTSAAFHQERGRTYVFALLKNDGGLGTALLSINGTPFSLD